MTPKPTMPILYAKLVLLRCRCHRRSLEPEQDFAGARDRDHAFVLATTPLVEMNGCRVQISQVDAAAALFGNTGGQRHLDAWSFNPSTGVVLAEAFAVRRVRQYSARKMLKAVPLLHEVIAAVVANLIDQLSVGIADLGKARTVDDDFAAVGNRRLDLVHAFGRGPQVVVHLRHEDSTRRNGRST